MNANNNTGSWRFNRQINVSTLVQIFFLASLIVASYVNLQRQLDLLQHDVTALLQSNKTFQQKLQLLSEKSISYEYRLRALEKEANDEKDVSDNIDTLFFGPRL